MITKSVSQQAVGIPQQPALHLHINSSIQARQKAVQSALLSPGHDSVQVQRPASYPAKQNSHPAVRQTHRQPQNQKGELLNQLSSIHLLNTFFTLAMSSSPSVFSPHTAENPTALDLEVDCCYRTAASDSPHDPRHTPLDPLCRLDTYDNTMRFVWVVLKTKLVLKCNLYCTNSLDREKD